MPSFKSTFLAVAAAFVATASAEDYFVEPDSVPKATRISWCADQRRMCPAICRQTDERDPRTNECNSDQLNYGCICGDGKKPNMTEYSLTLPYHICMEWGNQCVSNCGNGNNQCASSCREDNPCGAQNPTRVNSTSAAVDEPTASKTGEGNGNGIFTGMAGDGDDGDGDENSARSALEGAGRGVGVAVLVAGVIGGVAVML